MKNKEETPLSAKIIRSDRRKKTISARIVGQELLVYLPTGLSEKEEKKWVEKMVKWAGDQKRKKGLDNPNEKLIKRADQLNSQFFGSKLKWNSIEYVINQNRVNGSCTSKKGTIRLSDRLIDMPDWVRDYVIIHELAHLIQPNHSSSFWNIVNQYKFTERARGYLMASNLNNDEIE
ncbi:MAG: M48 family metallopeptidase [Candidatus Desantisbacteria bacterium]